MRSVLIAGCGYVGQAAGELFHQAGWDVEAWTRSAESAAKIVDKSYPVFAVDISEAAQMAAHARDFDAVIHCASTRGGDVDLYRRVYLDGARNLIERFVGSTIFFTGSTSVYAQTDGEWVTEESETTPTRETAQVLLETERLVLKASGIVARLAGIYGPGRSALLKKFLSGEVVGESDRFVNQVHRDDITSAIFLLLDRQPPADRIFNVADDHPLRQSDCYRWLSEHLERPSPSPARSTSSRKRGDSNKRVSNARLRGLGWTPRYPSFAEGMEKSVLPNHRMLSP